MQSTAWLIIDEVHHAVMHFTGQEQLGQPYQYQVALPVSTGLSVASLLQQPASLCIESHHEGVGLAQPRLISGLLVAGTTVSEQNGEHATHTYGQINASFNGILISNTKPASF